jgi:hypothetical protein
MEIVHIPFNSVRLRRKNFNSSNHWINGKPIDYHDRLEQTFTSQWIDEFHTQYYSFPIREIDIKWMREAHLIGRVSRSFPIEFKNELGESLPHYRDADEYLSNGKYFVRCENVSLKHGINGIGPYTSMKDIFESLVTAIPSHTPISENTLSVRVYLIPWKEINKDYEFRVFVHNNLITGISQQDCYIPSGFKESEIQLIIDTLMNYHREVVLQKIKLTEYSYDVVILGVSDTFHPFLDGDLDVQAYFIETNPFGKEYSSGSALFHWLKDEKILYGTDKAQFRYVKR